MELLTVGWTKVVDSRPEATMKLTTMHITAVQQHCAVVPSDTSLRCTTVVCGRNICSAGDSLFGGMVHPDSSPSVDRSQIEYVPGAKSRARLHLTTV